MFSLSDRLGSYWRVCLYTETKTFENRKGRKSDSGMILEKCILDIQNLYMTHREEYALSFEEVSEIERALRSGKCVFSPVKRIALPKEETNASFMYRYTVPELPEIALVCVPDTRVFLALARLLIQICFSSDHFLRTNFSFRQEGYKLFYEEILGGGKPIVNRFYPEFWYY